MSRPKARLATASAVLLGAVALSVAVLGLGVAAWGVGPVVPRETILSGIAAGQGPRVIDVRTTREYEAGHVPGAIHIPYQEIWLRREEIGAGKTERIILYCSHGPRAGMAALELRTLGYRDVAYLQGQMSAWRASGLPTRTGPDP